MRLLKDTTVCADYASGGGDRTWPRQIKIAYMALSSASDCSKLSAIIEAYNVALRVVTIFSDMPQLNLNIKQRR